MARDETAREPDPEQALLDDPSHLGLADATAAALVRSTASGPTVAGDSPGSDEVLHTNDQSLQTSDRSLQTSDRSLQTNDRSPGASDDVSAPREVGNGSR